MSMIRNIGFEESCYLIPSVMLRDGCLFSRDEAIMNLEGWQRVREVC